MLWLTKNSDIFDKMRFGFCKGQRHNTSYTHKLHCFNWACHEVPFAMWRLDDWLFVSDAAHWLNCMNDSEIVTFTFTDFHFSKRCFNQTAARSVSVLNKSCDACECPSCIVHSCPPLGSDYLPSHCSHFSFTWVQRWHPLLGRRRGPEGQWANSPSFTSTLSLPVPSPRISPLSPPTHRVLVSSSWTGDTGVPATKGETAKVVPDRSRLVSVVMATWPMSAEENLETFFMSHRKKTTEQRWVLSW